MELDFIDALLGAIVGKALDLLLFLLKCLKNYKKEAILKKSFQHLFFRQVVAGYLVLS